MPGYIQWVSEKAPCECSALRIVHVVIFKPLYWHKSTVDYSGVSPHSTSCNDAKVLS